MKSLKAIQTISKIGRILSKIVFICSIVGFCCCIAGIISLAAGMSALKIGDVTIEGFIQKEADTTIGTVYAVCMLGAIVCAGEAVLAKFAEHYFARELKDGTPFCMAGAKELQRLGILAIVIPIAAAIVEAIALAIMEHVRCDVQHLDLKDWGSVGLGIMMLVTAQICKYGAELREQNAPLPEGSAQ